MTTGLSSSLVRGRPSLRELSTFCIVGAVAFAVHFSVVVAIVPLGITALLANVLGFLCAFCVSFLGHNHLTFPAAGNRDRWRAMHRFARTALLGFVGNETLYWLLLRTTDLPYQLSLAIVLAVVAAVTLALSKFWAFADE